MRGRSRLVMFPAQTRRLRRAIPITLRLSDSLDGWKDRSILILIIKQARELRIKETVFEAATHGSTIRQLLTMLQLLIVKEWSPHSLDEPILRQDREFVKDIRNTEQGIRHALRTTAEMMLLSAIQALCYDTMSSAMLFLELQDRQTSDFRETLAKTTTPAAQARFPLMTTAMRTAIQLTSIPLKTELHSQDRHSGRYKIMVQ